MSLPIARARRKKVPSIQRSPNSSTRSHSRTRVLEAERGDVAGLLELGDLPVVLDQPQLGERRGRSRSSRRVVAGDQRVDAADRRRGARGSCRLPRRPPARARRCGGTSRPSESEISFSDGRRPAHSSPYCRSRKNSSVSRAERGPGVEHRLAVLDHQHRVAGLVAAEVGVRGVGAEAVVGVVGPHLEACRPAAPAARRGTSRPACARRAAAYVGDRVRAGRSSSRSPQPVRMKAE